MSFTIQSRSDLETQQIAACLIKYLQPSITLALEGDLGTGKTCFVAGLVHALDPSISVRSPTYALAHSYPTSPVIHHVDLYRIQGQNLQDLGIEDLLDDPEAIICIEWPTHAQNPLPTSTIWIYFTDLGENKRQIRFVAIDTRAKSVISVLERGVEQLGSSSGS